MCVIELNLDHIQCWYHWVPKSTGRIGRSRWNHKRLPTRCLTHITPMIYTRKIPWSYVPEKSGCSFLRVLPWRTRRLRRFIPFPPLPPPSLPFFVVTSSVTCILQSILTRKWALFKPSNTFVCLNTCYCIYIRSCSSLNQLIMLFFLHINMSVRSVRRLNRYQRYPLR